ncbi:hypothetical protein [Rhodococcus sp. UNC363MFTsu5.1]|uniref:hypothetical protein n=1 Tax=Rhodococcus sp. UNC363MFTsu5.1 TaxID=1449069 RepID=UPI000B01E4F2|nr:hypothetical protein [Rhodococcus sp. UNC363MFTsu5.1]
MTQPMIDSARLQFSGLSAEDFEDVPAIGEQRTYTILATCQSHNERAMANEGTRKSVNMKVVRVLSGVDHTIDDEPEEEPSLFGSDGGSSVDDEPESIGDIIGGAEAFQGPTFSAGDE